MFYLKILLTSMLLVMRVFGARDPPIVEIPDQGQVVGSFLKMYRTQRVIAYMGIPYAQPPTGDKRFMPPIVEDLPSWEGIRNGSMMPAICMQNTQKPEPKYSEVFKQLIHKMVDSESSLNADDQLKNDEDCLYLNIFVPDGPTTSDNSGYAVIAYLHSGDFQRGSPFELNPHQLVFKQKVILVTIGYRLNIFGFFTSLDGESQGNFGLMDQSAALDWLKKNIKHFGGNENSITLMGHGSGAISASLHLTSGKWSENYFERVIIMSGNSLMDDAVKPAFEYTHAIQRTADSFSCFRKPTSKLLDCLRRVPAKSLIESGPDVNWGPIIDKGLSTITEAFIEEAPDVLIEKGRLRKTPIMIGFTDMEEAFNLVAADMVDNGINAEMYDSMINEVVLNDFSKNDNNDTETMCSGNNLIVMEAVHFLYKPYPPTEDPLLLRKFYLDFVNDRKYMAPTILLAAHMSKQSNTFVYRFDIKPRTMLEALPPWTGMPHGFEQIFLWGLPYMGSAADVQWDTSDKRLADIIMTLWANFAKYTNPTQVGVYIQWEPFTHENPSLLIIDKSFNMSDLNSLNYRAIQFWNDYYPSVLQFALSCCNMTDLSGTESQMIIPTKTVYLSVFVFLIQFLILYNLPLT